MAENCYACSQEATLATAPLCERIYLDDLWRVAHAVNSTMRGWLVVLPRRHVTSVAELTAAEAAAVGPLLHRLSMAMHDALRCVKTYVVQFAEAEGFAHTHFHLVPRMRDLPVEHRGPGVFHYLTRPESEWLTADERTEASAEIARRLADG